MNTRVKWFLSWTTDPNELGYGTPTGKWKSYKNFSGTIKQCIEELKKIERNCGSCFWAYRIWRMENGERVEVTRQDYTDYIYERENY